MLAGAGISALIAIDTVLSSGFGQLVSLRARTRRRTLQVDTNVTTTAVIFEALVDVDASLAVGLELHAVGAAAGERAL